MDLFVNPALWSLNNANILYLANQNKKLKTKKRRQNIKNKDWAQNMKTKKKKIAHEKD